MAESMVVVTGLRELIDAYVAHCARKNQVEVQDYNYWVDTAKGELVVHMEVEPVAQDDTPRHRGASRKTRR